MFYSSIPSHHKREAFKELLLSNELIVLPGVYNAIVAQMIQASGAKGGYISGHMVAADLGLPDLGLTSVFEVSQRAHQICRVVDIPMIVDADTGFGEPLNVSRTIQTFEDAGLAGLHIEDQINPKKCGHSEGIHVVDLPDALKRISAAVKGRRDPNFLIIARTDARAAESLNDAIERAKRYQEAGADVIFPEALRDKSEYEAFRKEIKVPLMVNLNEFGRGIPLTQSEVKELGYNIAIYPMTLMRLAMGATQKGIANILNDGSQLSLLSQMQTKDELYNLLQYEQYAEFDQEIYKESK